MALTALAATPAPAAADLTFFLGLNPTPATRTTRGFGVGINLLIVGFEFEYARTAEDEIDLAPSLTTGMINGTIMTPTSGVQLYATAGGGFYRERLGTVQETSFGTNVGGGVKMTLVGPLRLRLDYRVFNLRGSPLHSSPQRFYAGANISF
jgi:opacity protein-like surface antigen